MPLVFNRNIITATDASNVAHALRVGAPAQLPTALAARPPALSAPAGVGPVAAAQVSVPTEDDFLTRLLKFVPLEVLGVYLMLLAIIDSNVSDAPAHRVWLASLLVGTLLITAIYDRRVLAVERHGQILMSVLGVAVYAFTTGGWFATMSWYHQWYGSIAVPLFVILAAVLKLKPLATTPAGPRPPDLPAAKTALTDGPAPALQRSPAGRVAPDRAS